MSQYNDDMDNNAAMIAQMIAQSSSQELPEEGLEEEAEIMQEPEEEDFYRNLRSEMDDKDAKTLAAELIKLIEQDKQTQRTWLDTAENMKTYLGSSLVEEDDKRSGRTYKTYDSTLAISFGKQSAQLTSGLLHESGMADYKIRSEIDEAKEERGEKRRAYFNYFVTSVDEGYYDDFKKFCGLLAWYGGVAKKIYIDPSSGEPRSRHIDPDDFIFNAQCSSVRECERLTHVLHLSRRDIILKQELGEYDTNVKLPYLFDKDAQDTSNSTNGSTKSSGKDSPSIDFTQYETHTYADIKQMLKPMQSDSNESLTLPEPWIITIDPTVVDILSIRRNSKKDDPRKERINHFVYYTRRFEFDSMGSGLAHDIGTNCAALSNIQSMTIDAAILKNNPAGFTSVRIKEQDAVMDMVPGTLTFLDTSPAPARDAFFMPPFQGADMGLMELRRELLTQTQEQAAVSIAGIAEMKDNTPMGTTVARMDEQNQLRSAIFQSVCDVLIVEMRMLEDVFAQTIQYQDFSFGGKNFSISAEDFADKDIMLVPMANPATNSATHRLLRSEALLKLSRESPGIANEKELFKMNCEALQISPQEIERIMTPEAQEETKPLDPITENMNLMQNKPVKAAIWQLHQAHIISHGSVSENPNLPPEVRTATAAHIQEHMAFQYLIETQQKMGMELPPLEELEDPETQNTIALKVAEVTHIPEPEQQPLDPVQLAAQAQEQENELRAQEMEKDAVLEQLKATVEVLKAQLRAKETEAKIASNERIAVLKSNTELKKQQGEVFYEQEQMYP